MHVMNKKNTNKISSSDNKLNEKQLKLCSIIADTTVKTEPAPPQLVKILDEALIGDAESYEEGSLF